MEVKKYAKVIVICLAFGFLLSFVSGTSQCSINKRQSERIGELDRQYSELSRRTSDIIGVVSREVEEIGIGLGSVAGALRLDATDLRSIASGVRQAAAEVADMEKRIESLDRDLSDFIGWYYDSLDAEIERELGIKIPGRQ